MKMDIKYIESCVKTKNLELIELDMEKICRTCLSTSSEMRSLFSSTGVILNENCNENISSILMSFVDIRVAEEEGLPVQICIQCIKNVHNSFIFKKQCEKIDDVLRQYIKELSVGPENEIIEETTSIKIEHVDEALNQSFTIESINEEENNPDTNYHISTYNDSHEFSQNENEEIVIPDNSENSIFSCPECEVCFDNKNYLKQHQKKEHAKKRDEFKCSICNQRFSQIQTLNRHAKIHMANQKNKMCTFCGKCFSRSDDLKRHIRIHTGERPYPCDQCPKRYKQSSELKEHQRTHSQNAHFMCTVCGKELATRNGLYVHMKVHRGEKNHECKICGNKYVTSGELNSHIKHIHSQQKPFACTFPNCSRAFVTKLSLETHLRAHTGERPFKCEICGKCLATSSSLIEHKRIHTGVKKKECSICKRKLGNSQALKKHMRIHSGERPYECKICKDRFICGSSLSTHVKTKHTEKKYECTICHKMFALRTKMRQHMRLHEEISLIESETITLNSNSTCCNICNVTFNNNRKAFVQHMLLHNPIRSIDTTHSCTENSAEQESMIIEQKQQIVPNVDMETNSVEIPQQHHSSMILDIKRLSPSADESSESVTLTCMPNNFTYSRLI